MQYSISNISNLRLTLVRKSRYAAVAALQGGNPGCNFFKAPFSRAARSKTLHFPNSRFIDRSRLDFYGTLFGVTSTVVVEKIGFDKILSQWMIYQVPTVGPSIPMSTPTFVRHHEAVKRANFPYKYRLIQGLLGAHIFNIQHFFSELQNAGCAAFFRPQLATLQYIQLPLVRVS